MTFEQIAKKLGISRQLVHQIYKTGMQKLMSPKVNQKLKDYLED